MKAKRQRDRGKSEVDQRVEQLRREVSRLSSELTKAKNQLKHYRAENRKVRSERDNLSSGRREQHQELRSNYRQAHIAVVRLGQQLSVLSEVSSPSATSWRQIEECSDDIVQGPLDSDKRNAATLVQAVSETLQLLEEAVGLSHHIARTKTITAANISPTDASKDTYSQEKIGEIVNERDSYLNIVIKQREQMRLAKTSHTKLLKKYADQKVVIKQLTSEREQTKVIISQWLTLSRELYRRTGGRPTEKRHQIILSTWKQYENWATKGASK